MTIHISENNEYLCKESWINYIDVKLRQPEHLRIEDIDSNTGLDNLCSYCKKEYSLRNVSTDTIQTSNG